MTAGVLSTTTWDPDGSGPLAAQLVAGGQFTSAGGVPMFNYVARWEGAVWQPFGMGFGGGAGTTSYVYALTTWDPDDSGPLPAQLVAGGGFTTAGGVAVNHIARWDGAAWQPFGTGMNYQVRSLTTWDPDGQGPLPAQLVAGGDFTTAGGVTVNGIARWDGAAWQPFGSGMNSRVSALTIWDPDGPGPLPAQLVAGGLFIAAGGVTANSIALWDGTAWQPFGTGMAGTSPSVSALTTWDPDGSGPLPALLVVGGSFATAGSVPANNMARWDGTTWQPFGSGMNNTVEALTTWDPDGPGPQPLQLVAGGSFLSAGGVLVNRVARWDGTAWQRLGTGMGDGGVYGLTTWDSDGSGPSPAQLVAGGTFTTVGGVTVNGIAHWDGAAWQPFGTGIDGDVSALTTWDSDGPGPRPAQLVAGGGFINVGSVPVNRIANWDGAAWQPFGTGMSGGWVDSLTTWDPDDSGPLSDHLVAGGYFTTAGGVTVNRIARWDGAAWQPFGTGVNSYVHALTTWDPDGSGPQPVQLVAGGEFTLAFGGGRVISRIARWDGAAWQPIGTGMSNSVYALTTWDPDEAGPLPAHLVAGGSFANAGSVPVNGIARWDGAAWQPFGSGMSGTVRALTTWDPDGSGPLPEQLVAGGSFANAGGVTATFFIARWNGTAWQPFGSGMNGVVESLTTWDPDGAGPLPAHLVAGGDFTTAGGVRVNFIARWDGAAWQPFGTGVWGPSVYSVTTWDPDGSGTLPARLAVGGSFAWIAGGVPSAYCALYGCTTPICPADLDNASGTGTTDGAVTIDDLLYFLARFEFGDIAADLDDGSGTGTSDSAVTIDDLLFFLVHFEGGC